MGEERREEVRGGAMREARDSAGESEGAVAAGLERTLGLAELFGVPERMLNDPLLGPRADILPPWSSSRP